MFSEVLPHGRKIENRCDSQTGKRGLIANSGMHQDCRRIDGASGENDFLVGSESLLCSW